jgi:hypothetical protein
MRDKALCVIPKSVRRIGPRSSRAAIARLVLIPTKLTCRVAYPSPSGTGVGEWCPAARRSTVHGPQQSGGTVQRMGRGFGL